MKITESRANDILHWLDNETENYALLFEKMTLHRDAAALIRQLQDAEQAAWHAGLDAGREQGKGNEHCRAEPQPVGVEDLIRRIDAAIERITSGRCTMRVPADPTDPDLVLADAGNWIQRHALAHQPAAVDEAMVEAVARAICVACEENPDSQGDARGNEFRWQDYRDAALAAISALTAVQQPAGDGCHCGTCTCNPNMTPAVRYDLSPAQQEGAIREHLIRLGWTPPKRRPYDPGGSLSEYGVFPECDAQQPAEGEVVFIDGVGAGRSSIKSCRDGVQWIMVGDRVYWPLSDSDAKRLHSACCGDGSFDGPASPAGKGDESMTEQQPVAEMREFRDKIADAIGNDQLRRFVEKHGEPVPLITRMEQAEARAKQLAEALRHQRWCRTCGEDGWDSCEEGRAAIDLLHDHDKPKPVPR